MLAGLVYAAGFVCFLTPRRPIGGSGRRHLQVWLIARGTHLHVIAPGVDGEATDTAEHARVGLSAEALFGAPKPDLVMLICSCSWTIIDHGLVDEDTHSSSGTSGGAISVKPEKLLDIIT